MALAALEIEPDHYVTTRAALRAAPGDGSWRWLPDAEVARTRPGDREQADIAHGPRRHKSSDQEETEGALRAGRADRRVVPEDSMPLQMTTRDVDLRGVPDLHEAFVRYLSNDGGSREEDARMHAVLQELDNARPVLCAVLLAHYAGRRSPAEIAAEIFLSRPTAKRMLREGTAWVRARFTELYAQTAG